MLQTALRYHTSGEENRGPLELIDDSPRWPGTQAISACGLAHKLAACNSLAPAGCLERLLATTLSKPGMYRMLLVYSVM